MAVERHAERSGASEFLAPLILGLKIMPAVFS
jgi:hypothetical protein